jgi:hypothetical protein
MGLFDFLTNNAASTVRDARRRAEAAQARIELIELTEAERQAAMERKRHLLGEEMLRRQR